MLKLLAALLMFIDHIGAYWGDLLPAPLVLFMRSAGRLAFPIYAWLLARGFHRTRQPLAYFIRMSLFAALSEGLIRWASQLAGVIPPGTNVLVTFSLALVMLSGYRLASRAHYDMLVSLRPVTPTPQTQRLDLRWNPGGIELDPRIGLGAGLTMMALSAVASLLLKPDYGLYGLLAVLLFHVVEDRCEPAVWLKRSVQGFIILNALFLLIRTLLEHQPVTWASLQCLSVLALPLCARLDSSKRPGRKAQYFFYVFYPLHLVALLLLRRFVIS